MVIEFVKMHGTGNDYVYIDCFNQDFPHADKLAISLAHRHFGVGGDGLILIKQNPAGDGEMVMYNADGSKSQMCGNGLRCVAKYLHDTYAPGKKNLKIQTGNGLLDAKVITGDDGKAKSITINMGKPIFKGLEIPTTIDKERVFEETLEAGGKNFSFSSVSMGNPHCVIYVEDVKNFPLHVYGPLIENHPIFPERVNVEFVEQVSRQKLIQRTWERGSGETWACGTGASAVAVVSRILGMTEEEVDIELLGGELKLQYQEGESVFMTGNAIEVFRGKIEVDPNTGAIL